MIFDLRIVGSFISIAVSVSQRPYLFLLLFNAPPRKFYLYVYEQLFWCVLEGRTMNLVGLFVYASAGVKLYFKFKFATTLYHIYLAQPACLCFIIIKYSTLVSVPTGHAAAAASAAASAATSATNAGGTEDGEL